MQTKKETNLGMVLDEMVKIHKLLLEERKVERCMRKMQFKKEVWVHVIVYELDAGNAREMKQNKYKLPILSKAFANN